jgi:hypothetical protein
MEIWAWAGEVGCGSGDFGDGVGFGVVEFSSFISCLYFFNFFKYDR